MGLGFKHTEESKKKISKSKKGSIPWIKGKHYTDKQKKKMSESRKRYFIEHPERILEIIKETTGKKQSPESIEKRVSHLRGKKRPKYIGDKIRAKMMGENNHSWRGGISPENKRIRTCAEMRRWIKNVLTRDNFTCRECGNVETQLNAHHIKSFRDFPELRFNVDNGITLCEKCHKELHKKLKAMLTSFSKLT